MFLAPDFETKILIDIAPKCSMDPDEQAKIRRHIQDRMEMVRLGVMRCPSWFQEELNLLDHRLRAWWDSWQEKWIIDRLQDEGVVERLRRMSEDGKIDVAQGEVTGLLANGAYYLTVIQFRPEGKFQLDRSLIEMLKRCDMQQVDNPKEYLAKKREQAEKTQLQNDKKGTEKVLAAVDSLSSKQLEQFIAVEEARANGDTITAKGSDAKFLERAKADRQHALAEAESRGETLDLDVHPDRAFNPGMHPRRYARTRRAK